MKSYKSCKKQGKSRSDKSAKVYETGKNGFKEAIEQGKDRETGTGGSHNVRLAG